LYRNFSKEKLEEIKERAENRENLLENIVEKSDPIKNFPKKDNFLALSRQWNSWYPSSLEVEGGCYIFNINQEIIIIDPGFNSLEALKRLGLDIRLIRYIFVTHFHPDHFANLIKLITRRTSRKNKLKVYLNTTTYDQFKIYSKGATEFEEINPEMVLRLKFEKEISFKVKVSILKCYHKEVGGATKSIGLKFTLEHINGNKILIGFMSDTDGSNEYMNYYKSVYDECNILIPHLGALHKEPLGDKHLYKNGLNSLLNRLSLEDRLIILGEFGFELATEAEFKRVLKELIPESLNYNDLVNMIHNLSNQDPDTQFFLGQLLFSIYNTIFFHIFLT